MDPFDDFPTEKATIEKSDGQIIGPYPMIFAGETILVRDQTADIEMEDVILRSLPSGKNQAYTVKKIDFYPGMADIPAHYHIKYGEDRVSNSDKPNQTINIHSPQAVQIGDYNTQQITATIQMLVQRIDDSDATQAEKSEAKSLLQRFLSHPLVAAVVGATIGLGES